MQPEDVRKAMSAQMRALNEGSIVKTRDYYYQKRGVRWFRGRWDRATQEWTDAGANGRHAMEIARRDTITVVYAAPDSEAAHAA